MTRSRVLTRVATEADVPMLEVLWGELRQVGGRAERAINPATAVDVRTRLLAMLGSPACRIVLACLDGVPVGMAVLQIARPDPFSDARVINVAHLVVSRTHQRRGVGHALLGAAADFAGERHIDHVSVSLYPSLRDASRFFARLGFAPAAVRRVVPASVLRRRLGTDAATTAFGESIRRRTRLGRPLPPQRPRAGSTEKV